MVFQPGNSGYWLGKKRPSMVGNKYAKGHTPWNKGLPPLHPFPLGNKLGLMNLGRPNPKLKGRKFSEEHKRKISLALKGKPKSSEHIKNKTKTPVILKCSICGKEFSVPPCHGVGRKKYCSYRCRNLSKTAEKCAWWKGGISFEPYPVGWNSNFKKQIRERDKNKCRICGKTDIENGRKLDVHHKDYNKKNISIENLISLCRNCHVKTNSNRNFWIEKFNEKNTI